MLANAQQDMEVSLAKMQLNKKVALTKSNNDKAAVLKKQNDELGNFFPSFICTAIYRGQIFKSTSKTIFINIAGDQIHHPFPPVGRWLNTQKK